MLRLTADRPSQLVVAKLVCLMLLLLAAGSSRRPRVGVLGLELDLNKLPEELEETEEEPGEEQQPAVVAGAAAADNADTTRPPWLGQLANKASQAARAAVERLPKYFDFDAFRRQYNRRYSSGSELLFRKAMFLQRCMRVFRDRVARRLGQLTYKVAVNKFADQSPNELRRMFMSAPPVEMRPTSYEHEEKELERALADRSSWDLELESQTAALGEDDDDDDDEDDNGGPPLEDSTIVHESQAMRLVEWMLVTSYNQGMRRAIKDELGEAPMVDFSQSCSADANTADNRSRRPLPWPGKLRSVQGALFDLNQPPVPESEGEFCARVAHEYRAPKIEAADEGLDWSEHECFHSVYDQKSGCGRCYVFAATQLAEFYKCTEVEGSIELRKFSKNYVLDCAQKYSPANRGCLDGSLLETLRFIADAGIFNMSSWKERRSLELERLERAGLPATELDVKCPLDKLQTPVSQWGPIRVEMNPRLVHTNDWLEALQDGPLVASVQMPPVERIASYAGDVHDGAGCESSGNWHAMVLVGYGTHPDQGTPYWRFRNSFGPDWGDKGHFNLATDVSGKCLAGGVRVYREPFQG